MVLRMVYKVKADVMWAATMAQTAGEVSIEHQGTGKGYNEA